jgi:hypothetical protein
MLSPVMLPKCERGTLRDDLRGVCQGGWRPTDREPDCHEPNMLGGRVHSSGRDVAPVSECVLDVRFSDRFTAAYEDLVSLEPNAA